MLAFTLMMAAWSLRTWRRNGVACDELLFLPGTLHGHEHGVEGPLIELPTPTATSVPESNDTPSSRRSPSKADMAAGGFSIRKLVAAGASTMRRRQSFEEMDPLSEEPSYVSEDGDSSNYNTDENIEENDNETSLMSEATFVEERQQNGIIQKFRELWHFFFFRATSGVTASNATYAPSGPAVFGAALDLSMPVLFNFHIYIEAYNHLKDDYEAPVKILPLIFISVLMVRTIVPPGRRLRFWGTLKFTFTAPLHRVRFRDEYIGEALTSWIRPGQDIFFALSYYFCVIWGTVSGKYGLTESGDILQDSWWLHNVLLPSVAILPLWLKYMQTLRQAYDANKRWPYQGNAFKYLLATVVIIYGNTKPEQRSNPLWLAAFFVALIYQIVWDAVMDWDLFEIQRDVQLVEQADQDSFCYRISSFRPTSTILLNVQMYLVQPVLNGYQRIRVLIPSWRQVRLRQKRLYKSESFYWKIFVFNTITRFTWMMCLLPSFHVSKTNETVLTSTSDVNSYWGVLLPVAEIVRRTLWGFLFVERETIRMMDADVKYSQITEEEDSDEDNNSSKYNNRIQRLPTWLDNQQQVAHNAATSRAKQRVKFMHKLYVLELHVWAAAFILVGCWAAS